MFAENNFVTRALNLPDAAPAERTVLVIGAARGGTTLVSSSLSDLGAPMFHGDNVDFEDDRLAALLQGPDPEAARPLIAERNAMAPVWGFKRPRMAVYIGRVLPLFRNPRVVVVIKNPLSVANRMFIKRDGADSFQHCLAQVMDRMGRMQAFVSRAECPLLLVSYEGAVDNLEAYMAALCDFAGADPAAVPAALARQPGNRAAYLERRPVEA